MAKKALVKHRHGPEIYKAIVAMYKQEPNKTKIARTLGVSLTTVYKALGKIDPEEQREIRQEAMGRIATKLTKHIETLADGLILMDGASPMQKATMIGIFTDKLEKLDKRLEEAKREEVLAASPLPETIEALAGAIRNEMRDISFVFNMGGGQKVIAEARELEDVTGQKLIEAEVIRTIDDVDGR